VIGGRFGILPTHAGMSGQMFTVAHHPMVRGRYRDFKEAKRHADRLHAMVYDLTANRVVYTSDGAEEAFQTGRAGPIGRMLNRADRKVDELES
jgi:hypothetical protein